MGSLAICTKIFCPAFNTSVILPSLKISGSDWIFDNEEIRFFLELARITSYNVCYTKLLRLVKDKPAGQASGKVAFSGLAIDRQAAKQPGRSLLNTPKPGKAQTAVCAGASCGCQPATQKRHALIEATHYAFIELLQDIAKWLIIGFLIAALISVLLPDNFFSLFQGLGIIEILVILAASVPIYICATGSIPIAAVLLLKGVSPGAALVFLMAGPATNAATMTVIGKTMGRKSLLVYLGTITGGAILFGLLINWLIPADFILDKIVHIRITSYNVCYTKLLRI